MQYSSITQAKLAQMFSVTAAAMRKALVDKGLVDPDLKVPTKIGHLVGGASYVEREVEGHPQRWPVWDVSRIQSLFPGLGTAEGESPTVFKDRFKAMDALCAAGGTICDGFSAATVDGDPDLRWLYHAPGHGSLMTMNDRMERRRWCRSFLMPLRDRVAQRVSKSRRPGKAQMLAALRDIDGVVSQLLGTKPPAIAIGDPLPEHLLDVRPDTVVLEPGAHSFEIGEQDLKVLLAGYVITEGGDSDDDQILYEALVDPLRDSVPDRFGVGTLEERCALTRIGDDLRLIVLSHIGDISDVHAFHGTAWEIGVSGGRLRVVHEPVMKASYRDGRPAEPEVGNRVLSDRAYALHSTKSR